MIKPVDRKSLSRREGKPGLPLFSTLKAPPNSKTNKKEVICGRFTNSYFANAAQANDG